MTVRLRTHHLLCLLTYVGRGYSDEFVAGMDLICARLTAGEDVLLVEGPDEICARLIETSSNPHCHGESVSRRDALAAIEIASVFRRHVFPNAIMTIDRNAIQVLRRAFSAGTVRSACRGCEWDSLCTAVARDGYPGTRLFGPLGC